MPACSIVGTSGAIGERAVLVMASARNFPAFTCCIAFTRSFERRSTSPASSAFSAGAAPLYGTCVIAAPVFTLKTSTARCGKVPLLDGDTLLVRCNDNHDGRW